MRYSNISLCRARLDLPYGTHHTYVSVCLYVCLSVGVCLFRSVSCPGFICQISLIRTCAVNSDCYSTHVIVALIIQKRLSWSWLWSQYWLVVVVVTVLVGRGCGHSIGWSWLWSCWYADDVSSRLVGLLYRIYNLCHFIISHICSQANFFMGTIHGCDLILPNYHRDVCCDANVSC